MRLWNALTPFIRSRNCARSTAKMATTILSVLPNSLQASPKRVLAFQNCIYSIRVQWLRSKSALVAPSWNITDMILSLSDRVSDTNNVMLPTSTTACPTRLVATGLKTISSRFCVSIGPCVCNGSIWSGSRNPSFHRQCLLKRMSLCHLD